MDDSQRSQFGLNKKLVYRLVTAAVILMALLLFSAQRYYTRSYIAYPKAVYEYSTVDYSNFPGRIIAHTRFSTREPRNEIFDWYEQRLGVTGGRVAGTFRGPECDVANQVRDLIVIRFEMVVLACQDDVVVSRVLHFD